MDTSYKNIGYIAFPVLVSLLLEHLINITDTAFLGHVGEVELGASALGGVYYMAIYMLGFGFSIGVQILIARRNGERRYGEIGNILGQGAGFLLLLAGFMFVFTKLVSPVFLSKLIHSPNVYNAVIDYLDWRIFGFFFSFTAINFRAFFIGTTQTRILTFNSIIMVGSNVVLNYILIFGKFGIPPMGIAGAAIASTLAECVSMIFYVLYIWKRVDRKKYNLSFTVRLNRADLKQVFRVSVWTMLQSFVFPSQWFLFFTAVEHLGERSLAIANITRSINTCFFMIIFAFADTTSSLVSNLLGENKGKGEIWSVCKRAMILAYVVGIPFLVLTGMFPSVVLSIFTNDIGLVSDARSTIYVMLFGYILAVPGLILFNAVAGTGNTFGSLKIMLVTVAIYMVYVVIMVMWLQHDVAVGWTSEYLYSGMLLILSLLFLHRNAWRKAI